MSAEEAEWQRHIPANPDAALAAEILKGVAQALQRALEKTLLR